MNAIQPKIQTESLSLDKTLHSILEDIASARVAAMQILVFHMQSGTDTRSDIAPAEFMAASNSIEHSLKCLRTMQTKHLDPLGVTLPNKLSDSVLSTIENLAELMRILERCSSDSDDEIKGFQGVADMYDLCCTRVAQGIGALVTEMSTYFLELTEKDKVDAQEKTSSIAMEIGKIGRVINMVATNASIEAARAGDAGKGFTVIADEVKTLSSRVSSLSVSLTDRLQ